MEKGKIVKSECLHCGHKTWHAITEEDSSFNASSKEGLDVEVYY